MRRMAFSNPVFREKGLLNCTVRRGDHWGSVKIGDEVSMIGKGVDRIAVVKKKLICVFEDLKKIDISCAHDKKCREKDGLFEVMKALYPDFAPSSIVTVVYFEMKEKE